MFKRSLKSIFAHTHLPERLIKAFSVNFNCFTVLWCWAQEDVEEHSKEHKDYIAHYTEPETRVLQELLVVSAEEDIADGHPGHHSSKMSHKRHLRGEKCETSGFRVSL